MNSVVGRVPHFRSTQPWYCATQLFECTDVWGQPSVPRNAGKTLLAQFSPMTDTRAHRGSGSPVLS
jgi:hypothetical protein